MVVFPLDVPSDDPVCPDASVRGDFMQVEGLKLVGFGGEGGALLVRLLE